MVYGTSHHNIPYSSIVFCATRSFPNNHKSQHRNGFVGPRLSKVRFDLTIVSMLNRFLNCIILTAVVAKRNHELRFPNTRAEMDAARQARRSARTSSPVSSLLSRNSERNADSALKSRRKDLNIERKEIFQTDISNTSNLNYIENGNQSIATSNGKACISDTKSNYIPPVKSREHNTRSKNGIRKESKSVSCRKQVDCKN